MPYDSFAPTEFLDIFSFMSTTTGDLFGYFLIVSFFAMTFLSIKIVWPSERAFLASSVLSLSLGVLLVALGTLSTFAIAPLIISVGIGIIISGGSD